MTAAQRPVVREQLRDVTGTAIGLGERLEEIVAVPVSTLGRSGKRGRIDHSQPPWNAPVAHLILEMHSLARYLEDGFRIHLKMRWQPRGGTDENTRFALLAILNLSEAAEDSYVFEAVRTLDNWNSRALIVLGERDMPQRLPRNVGESEPRCPYCQHLTLRFWSSRAVVRCVNPECFHEGRRPTARIEYSIVARDWVLAWNDGSVGMPTDQRIA